MNKSGYVKFDRKILKWSWYTDSNTFKLFFHLVMSANYADGNFLGVEVKRGQVARSYKKLSDETGLTVNEIRTALKKLKSTREITQTTHAKFSVFTVVSYDKYQTVHTDFHTQSTRSSHAFNTDLTQREKRKIKNNNIIINNKGVGTYSTVVDLYHSLCPSLPAVKNLTPTRIEELDKLLEAYDMDTIHELFVKAERSDFLKGLRKTNGRDWKATFGWLIDVDNATKVLEGNFDNEPDKAKDSRYDFESFDKMAFEKVKNS